MVRAFGREEVVMFDVLGEATAGDETVFHAPELGYAFPLVEGFAVEQRRGRCGGGCAESGERQRGECEAERVKIHGFAGTWPLKETIRLTEKILFPPAVSVPQRLIRNPHIG